MREPYFKQSFPGESRENFFINAFLQGAFFQATNSQNIWLPYFAPVTTVTRELPARVLSLGISFLTVISRGTYIIAYISTGRHFF
jgi:hypothetical protein